MVGEIVDTSAWVALYDATDSNHAAAASHWTALQQARIPLYSTDYILDESLTLARRRASHAPEERTRETATRNRGELSRSERPSWSTRIRFARISSAT